MDESGFEFVRSLLSLLAAASVTGARESGFRVGYGGSEQASNEHKNMTRSTRPQLKEDSVQVLFQEARRRSEYEGVSSYGEYRDLVEDLLQERMNEGVFGASEDLPTVQRDLEMMWPQVEKTLW